MAELQAEGRRIIQRRYAMEAQAAEADLQRLRQELDAETAASLDQRPAWMVDGFAAALFDGNEPLRVVGESQYQDNLRRLAGTPDPAGNVRAPIMAVLVPEPKNPADPNAIAIWINGWKAGYLAQDDAPLYRPGLLALQQQHGKQIALSGAIVGRGTREGGRGLLGVLLEHDPEDFGIRR